MTGRASSRHPQILWLSLLLVALVECAAVLHGADGGWDTRNYHLYNPFAFLNKHAGVDIAPAHMQTWFSPTLDFFYYAAARAAPSVPVLNVVTALPHAVAAVLSFVLTCRLLQAETGAEHWLAFIAVVIGSTGAAVGATIASAFSEMIPASCVLLALLVLIPPDLKSPPSPRRILAAGSLAGAACGLKLTFAYVAIGLAVMLAALPWRGLRVSALRLALLAAGGFIGTAAFAGYWWVIEWRQFGNPVFPMYNHIFRSPATAPSPYVDFTFLAHSVGAFFNAPWFWALSLSTAVGESRMRDPRMSLAIVAALICLGQTWLRRRNREPSTWPVPFIAGWFLICFFLWRLEFSIFRYLSALELFTGPLIALAALPVARWMRQTGAAAFGLTLMLIPLTYVTVYPTLTRARAGSRPLEVQMPQVARDGMVLLLDTAPMAYLALFQHPDVRFIATNDYVMTLDNSNPMQAEVARAIAGHTGELWGLDVPLDWGTMSDASLTRYGLVRGECRQVTSALDLDRVRMCRLSRK